MPADLRRVRLDRLRDHYPGTALHRVRLRWMPFWLRPFVRRQLAAITLGNHVYFRPGARVGVRLVAHELVHVAQQQAVGRVRHAWRYVTEYFRLRRSGLDETAAYRAISYEVEARARAEEVLTALGGVDTELGAW